VDVYGRSSTCFLWSGRRPGVEYLECRRHWAGTLPLRVGCYKTGFLNWCGFGFAGSGIETKSVSTARSVLL
jgi:hypothetical protein